ncbi:AMP-dependent synthetase/ligase [Williamsia sterculiae]|uniref:Acyl-CoA synthetase n=1 Tax=Williamsia sterculiae TaxID=1344003 RepID=A0A1N7HG52_9NOCA|nr:long-chain fatty acid--CoA ligase [Williamsia sterculiae]SIS23772.1 long-chain acyl-CoA synthetase [Williamsia sterculiae]
MQQVSTPSTVVVSEKASLVDSLLDYRRERPDLQLFRRRINGRWTPITARRFADEVDAVARGLIASGVAGGDRVAILSSTRYEWTVLDYAVWRVGATTVAIYETSASDQVKWILEDSASSLLVVENSAHHDAHADVVSAAPDLRDTLLIDAGPDGTGAIDELTRRGADIGEDELDQRHSNALSSNVATLIYTSGTTGNPKGVTLTHANFLAETRNVHETVGEMMSEGASTLLFLPLAHVFARIIAVASVENRVILGHTNDIANLLDDLAAFQPTYLLSVPRVFEKVYNSAKQKAYDGGKGKIFDAAADVAIEYSKALETGGPGLVLKAKHTLFARLVYSKLLAALGGRCEDALSGGAPLGARLGHFFRGIGLPIYEGYGLTETTAAVTLNRPGAQRVGTVGKPVAGQSVAIADDGEVLLKGSVVFDGYWHNESATADALRDGWFHTGDIGTLDDGYLTITGRKKELIVTAGGKNVSPAPLEDSIRAHPMVSQCLVVGDNRPFIAALVTIDPEAVPGWLERHEMSSDTSLTELATDERLIAEIDEAVTAANKKVSKAEAIKKFRVLDTDFTIESGALTPTMKLKRNVIHRDHADLIDKLYTR